MKIVLVIAQLGPGGAEKVMSIMANYFINLGHSVSLVTIGNSDAFYKLDAGVKLIPLNAAKPSSSFIKSGLNIINRLWKLCKAVKRERPDIAISFMTETNIISIIAGKLCKVPVIVSERTNPWEHPLNGITIKLRTLLYKTAAALVTQTQESKHYYDKILKSDNIYVIHNPIVLHEYAIDKTNTFTDNKIILNIGRLSQEKGQDILIDAFSQAKASNEWKLWIVGEGNNRDALQRQIDKLNLSEKVLLLGRQKDIKGYLEKVSVYVHSSRYEGFPNALLEAMAMGKPCISTDCPTGPSELLNDGENGLLVPTENPLALSIAIDRLAEENELRTMLGKQAQISVRKFDYQFIMSEWLDLTEKILKTTVINN